MNIELKLNQMYENYMSVSKAFRWEQNLYHHFVALMVTQADKNVDTERIKQAQLIIKDNTGIFSEFRSHSFMLGGLISLESDTVESVFNQINRCEQYLKSAGFRGGQYLPLTAFTLYKCSEKNEPNELAQKAFKLYLDMKANHPWITNNDDYAMAILLANADLRVEKSEFIYNRLNELGLSKGNELQALSHILAFSDRQLDEVVARCMHLKDTLKKNGMAIYSSKYSILGVVTLIALEDESIENQWLSAIKHLQTMKTYKWLGKDVNMILASSLVCSEWIKEFTNNNLDVVVVGITLETILAAQMAAMLAATTAVTVACTTANT